MSNLVKKDSPSEVVPAPAIAIIDDDRDLSTAVSRVLRANYKCVVTGFGSVEDFLGAVDRHTSSGATSDFADLILLDFHLPGKNGPVLVRELEKRQSALLSHSRIVGITGDAEPVVYAGFKDAGIDEVLLKPLRQIDFGRIADRAYRISQRLDSRAPVPSVFKGTI